MSLLQIIPQIPETQRPSKVNVHFQQPWEAYILFCWSVPLDQVHREQVHPEREVCPKREVHPEREVRPKRDVRPESPEREVHPDPERSE